MTFCQSNCFNAPPSLSLFVRRRPRILLADGIVETDAHEILISIVYPPVLLAFLEVIVDGKTMSLIFAKK